jgi:RND family efflux transporter MFP subunit
MSCPRPPSIAVACIASVLGLSGCQQKNQYVEPPPAVVEVAQPARAIVGDQLELTGTTHVQARVDLRARVNGYLEKIHFVDGTEVKQGDLLFTIEQAPFRTKADIAAAELSKAKAGLQLAESELARARALLHRNASTMQELDIKESQRNSAAASVDSAEAALRDAELQLSYTLIRAPIDGRIGRHQLDVGNLVMPEQTLLATIESHDPIHVYFTMSDSDFLRLSRADSEVDTRATTRPSRTVQMGLGNDEGFPHTGEVDFNELGIDPETGTAMYRAVFKNPNLRLVPGLFARVRIGLGEPASRLVVPESALGTDQRGDFLLLVGPDNIVEQRSVRLGILSGGSRVVEQGLSGEEWVIVKGLQRARPGVRVQPRPQGSPLAAPPVSRSAG